MQTKENGKKALAGRVFALVVVLLLALGLCACGKKGGGTLVHTGIVDITCRKAIESHYLSPRG